MSNKIFCPNCYKPTLYESSAPSFCSHCSKSFNNNFNETNASVKPAPLQQKQPRPQMMPIVEDEEFIQVPHIDRIQFQIDPNFLPKTQKLESLIGTKQEKPQPLMNSNNKKSSKKPSQEQLKKIWAESFPKTNRSNPNSIEGNE